MMNVQELVINLKVISTVGVNQKLNTKNIILNVEPLSIIPEFARRWIRQDNREETIKRITEIVDESINYFNKHFPSVSQRESYARLSKTPSDENIDNEITNEDLQKSVYFDCAAPPTQTSSRMRSSSKIHDSNIVNITKYLIDSKNGLDNLKKTYSSCMMTVAKIDWIIDKINDALKVHVMEV